MEFNVLGRVCKEVEQASAHFPAAPCLRIVDVELQTEQAIGNVSHVLPFRLSSRACHGNRDQENPVSVLTTYYHARNISLILVLF